MRQRRVSSLPSALDSAFSFCRKLWIPSIERTHFTGERQEVVIDRKKAFDLVQSGKQDIEGKSSVFGQCFRQLSGCEPAKLRGKTKAFTVIFRGESGEDAGGVYREALEQVCRELQSSSLPLFVQCANGVQGVGVNRDKWLPSPAANSPSHVAMLEFVGQMIGIALRTKNLLSLDLAPIVWKVFLLTVRRVRAQ